MTAEPGNGETPAGAADRGHLRASHADREQVIATLKAAFVQGRLNKDELDARAGQTFAARTYAELAAITADHGNCEYMRNPDGSPHTAHTTNLVHAIYVAEDAEEYHVKDGILADMAPTLLEMLGVLKPKEMTGSSLLEKK